jgi:hypothetical protein
VRGTIYRSDLKMAHTEALWSDGERWVHTQQPSGDGEARSEEQETSINVQ